MLLPMDFFARATDVVARELIGCILTCRTEQGVASGRIVETEAYLGAHDPACHSAVGPTDRNAVMFGLAGRAYIYHIYGIHLCFNITTDAATTPAAVLVRAIEPLTGIDLMRRRRGREKLRELAGGPARLVAALGMTAAMNGTIVNQGPICVAEAVAKPEAIAVGPRIGISKAQDWPLRFGWAGSPCLSRPFAASK